MKYTKDQLRAIEIIINARRPWMDKSRHLQFEECNIVLNDTTLIRLNEPVWSDGEEYYGVPVLLNSNATHDKVTVDTVDPSTTHYDERRDYCKIAEDAYFDPISLKRAMRVLKYHEQPVTLHYTTDPKTQQRYCNCLTFSTAYGFALVMACRIKDESALREVEK